MKGAQPTAYSTVVAISCRCLWHLGSALSLETGGEEGMRFEPNDDVDVLHGLGGAGWGAVGVREIVAYKLSVIG